MDSNGRAPLGAANPEGPWVVVDEDERYTPSQLLTNSPSPQFHIVSQSLLNEVDRESDTSSSTTSSQIDTSSRNIYVRSRHFDSFPTNFRVTPGLSLFNGIGSMNNFSNDVEGSFTPASLGFDNDPEITPGLEQVRKARIPIQSYSFRSEIAARMLEAENNLELVRESPVGVDRLPSKFSLNSEDEEINEEINRIISSSQRESKPIETTPGITFNYSTYEEYRKSLKYNGRAPPVLGSVAPEAIMFDINVQPAFLQRSKSVDPLLHTRIASQNVGEVNFVAILKQNRNENNEQKSIRRKVEPKSKNRKQLDWRKRSWVVVQCKQIVKFIKLYAMPVAISHILALMIGFYFGKTSFQSNTEQTSVDKVA